MATCPFRGGSEEKKENGTEASKNASSKSYADILQLTELLSLQDLIPNKSNEQHLFITIHQVYELWFKQVNLEIDSVRELFMSENLDEGNMLKINNRLHRCVLIWQTLVQQLLVLETMSAMDFYSFRDTLENASGFQSLQFRLLENKLGIKEERRVRYQQKFYKDFFTSEDELKLLSKSTAESSLLSLLEKWLERTPGLEPKDFHFWMKYSDAVDNFLTDQYLIPAEQAANEEEREQHMASYKRMKEVYDLCINEQLYYKSHQKGERHLSHKAYQGALMIALYRDEPRFNQPYKMLTLLMDIDNEMMKWRHNHAAMVQRMIGTKVGTGGSSGYAYLRSTVSDRYRPFLDLFNLSTYIIPRDYIPSLSMTMKKRLSLRQ